MCVCARARAHTSVSAFVYMCVSVYVHVFVCVSECVALYGLFLVCFLFGTRGAFSLSLKKTTQKSEAIP